MYFKSTDGFYAVVYDAGEVEKYLLTVSQLPPDFKVLERLEEVDRLGMTKLYSVNLLTMKCFRAWARNPSSEARKMSLEILIFDEQKKAGEWVLLHCCNGANKHFCEAAQKSGPVLSFPVAYPSQEEEGPLSIKVVSFSTRMAAKAQRQAANFDLKFSAANLYVSNLVVSKYLETANVVEYLLRGDRDGSLAKKRRATVGEKTLPMFDIPYVFWVWFPARKVSNMDTFLADIHSPDYEADFSDEELPTIEGWYMARFESKPSLENVPADEGLIIYEGDSRLWSGPMFLSKCPSASRLIQGNYSRVVQIAIPSTADSGDLEVLFFDSNGGHMGNESSAFVVQAVRNRYRSLVDCSGPARSDSSIVHIAALDQKRDEKSMRQLIRSLKSEERSRHNSTESKQNGSLYVEDPSPLCRISARKMKDLSIFELRLALAVLESKETGFQNEVSEYAKACTRALKVKSTIVNKKTT